MDPDNNYQFSTSDSKPSNEKVVNKFRELSEKEPKFNEFLESYQKGEWAKCRTILDELVSKYPDVALLKNFDQDLDVQLSLREISQKHVVENKKKAIRQGAKISVFTVSLIFLLLVIATGAFVLIRNYRILQNQQQNQNQLTSLVAQAEQLILSGQPESALSLIKKISDIDPGYERLASLQAEADQLNQLEVEYQDALELLKAEDYEGARTILAEIEKTRPNMWDVERQLTLADNKIKIRDFFIAAQVTYEKEDWVGVITNYEAALDIDPKLDDGLMKEQLLNGYLRAIIQMLENNSTSIEDIERAETYYRAAVAMIPQSRTFSAERENLREVSSSLLVLKYSQTAYLMLEDSNQTVNSIGKAVSYLSKATNLSPNDAQLQNELSNAQLYQIGFQYFVDMNWGPAIDNLKRLVDIKKNYASGKASILLYEAYAARGRQYYTVGLYIDARSNFEQAEIIAWEHPENPFMQFDVQLWLGDTIGRLRDYANALSYYQYAVTNINIYPKLDPNTEFARLFYAAEALAGQGDQQEAYQTYVEAMEHLQDVYEMPEVKVADGACLAFFAADNRSTIYAVQKVNNLLKNVTVTFGQDLIAPTISK